MYLRFVLGLLVAGVIANLPAHAQEGVTSDEVRFAQVAGFEGSFGTVGREFRLGLEAAFAEVNRKGGVHGRSIVLEKYDDSNEPHESVRIVRDILREDRHLALIGMSGPQSARVVQADLKSARMPFLAPASSDPFLRELALSHVRTLRPDISAETEALTRHLVEERGFKRIALLYQSDAYGRQGRAALEAALAARGLELSATARYPRNTNATLVPLLRVHAARPQAVVLLAENGPASSFISMALAVDFSPLFVVGSRVSPSALIEDLGADAEGVILAHAAPTLWTGSSPGAEVFRTALSDLGIETLPDALSFQGYVAGRYAIALLQEAGRDLDRANFAKAMRKTKSLNIDGHQLSFGLGDTQGSDHIGLVRIAGAEVQDMQEAIQ